MKRKRKEKKQRKIIIVTVLSQHCHLCYDTDNVGGIERHRMLESRAREQRKIWERKTDRKEGKAMKAKAVIDWSEVVTILIGR